MDDDRYANLDSEELKQAERDDMTGEEEHRYDEFEDLRDKLDTISNSFSEMFDMVRSIASFIENKPSEEAIEALNGDDDAEIFDMTPDIDGEDLQL